MNQQQRDLYEATLDSLTRHPEQWTRDAFMVTHIETGAYVWIANRHYGLGIGINGNSRWRQETMGGVTAWSSLFGPLIPWRAKLRKAALAVANPDEEATRAKVDTAIHGLAA